MSKYLAALSASFSATRLAAPLASSSAAGFLSTLLIASSTGVRFCARAAAVTGLLILLSYHFFTSRM
jgi:hypothetical protein